jgi:purine-binding chemotaxis protein CheW
MIDVTSETAGDDKYLVFQLGPSLYATPLIEVREVIEYQSAKPIPHTAPFFKGVINIRGEIVGVIDLRMRLGIQEVAEPEAQLIYDAESGPLAAIVDKVLSVAVISEANLDRRLTGSQQGENRYLVGIGKADDKIFTVVSLKKMLTAEQIAGNLAP